MQIHKITITVIDFDELGAQSVCEVIENARYPNHCISPYVLTIETRDIGAWDDDHPLNHASTEFDEIQRLFS